MLVKFKELFEHVKVLQNVQTPTLLTQRALPGVPSELASFGFNGANVSHFFKHTWEFIDISKRLNKPTTFWLRGITGYKLMEYLTEGIKALNPPGSVPPFKPLPGTPETIFVKGVEIQIGSKMPEPVIGQLFPTKNNGLVTIVKQDMQAIWDILKP